MGFALARAYIATVARMVTHQNMAASVLLQFLGTFGVWIMADKLGLSAVLTVVAYGMTIARHSRGRMGPRERRLNFAIWEVAVFGLNVMAFLITGLQIRQIFDELNKSWNYVTLAASVLVACVAVRVAWVMIYTVLTRWQISRGPRKRVRRLRQITPQTALVVGWAGMRGIVTLGTALALPFDFPQRDLIQFTAFAVVLGTLGFQGMTLRPLIDWLTLPVDTSDDEATMARTEAARAGLESLGADRDSRAGQLLTRQYERRLAEDGEMVDATGLARLQRQALGAEREQIVALHRDGRINDEVFGDLEEELDWSEAALDKVPIDRAN
jgi:NhaP-type Na+/H+ or K+/H+ antiporter